jgi:hypothetical protein
LLKDFVLADHFDHDLCLVRGRGGGVLEALGTVEGIDIVLRREVVVSVADELGVLGGHRNG